MWIWSHTEVERLPSGVARLLADPSQEYCLSTVSLWETMLALERGRVSRVLSPEATVRSWLLTNPIELVPLNSEIAILSRALSFNHEDPADRFIAATAFHLGCPLATVDPNLRRLPWIHVIQD